MGTKLRVVGMDPSLRNWGIAVGELDLDTKTVLILKLTTITPVLSKGKQVRQNSLDLESAQQLCAAVLQAVKQADAIFVEVPVGSQSARAMASYGICVGIMGSLRAAGTPFFEVTPTEVKVSAVGNPNAKKAAMIAWGLTQHPEANWPTYRKNGMDVVSEAQAEHMADAIATIYAGLKLNQFHQLITTLTNHLGKNHANHLETA